MLTTEIYTDAIPELFSRFSQVIGEQYWLKRAKLRKEAIKGNPFLREHIMIEDDIAFQLDRLSRLAKTYGGSVPLEVAKSRDIYPAAAFVAQVLSFVDTLPNLEKERFCRRVRGCFRNPDDMRGLLLEMCVATHFIRRGKHVTWPEITGVGTFDLLVEDVGSDGLEIECKSISSDKGCKVHRHEALDFFNLLKRRLRPTICVLSSGLYAVLTLPGRLPEKYSDRERLAREFGESIFSGRSKELDDGSSIRVGGFDVSRIHTDMSGGGPNIRTMVDDITGTSNREVIIVGTRAGGALALAIQSIQDDNLLGATFDTLSKAARVQLSGRRAGMLIAGFSGLSSEQLLLVAREDRDSSQAPSALRLHVSRFLASSDRPHVVGVGFLSSTALRPVEASLVESGGTAYYFAKEDSAYWSNEFKAIFSSMTNQ